MDETKTGRPCDGVAMVVPADRAAATRRIAGVAAISRVLIEASRAGVIRAFVVLDAPGQLAAVVADDLARAGRQLTVDWSTPDQIEPAVRTTTSSRVLLLSTRTLVAAGALRRLLDQEGEAVLVHEHRPLAAQLWPTDLRLELDAALDGQGREILDAAPQDAIDLSAPSKASRTILRQTGKTSDGLISRWLNRQVSRAMSGVLLQVGGVRPWHMTVVTAATGLAMFAALCFGGARGLVMGGLLFQLASIVDGVDGEIARATFRSSVTGAAMDTAVDMMTNLMFVLGVTVGLGRVYGPLYWQIGGVDFLIMMTGLAIMTVLVRREPGGTSFDLVKNFYARRYTTGPIARIFVVLKTLTSRDFFAFAFAVLAATGLSRAIPWAFAGAASIWLALVIGAAVVLLGRSAAR